jgi:hypothetical protein
MGDELRAFPYVTFYHLASNEKGHRERVFLGDPVDPLVRA